MTAWPPPQRRQLVMIPLPRAACAPCDQHAHLVGGGQVAGPRRTDAVGEHGLVGGAAAHRLHASLFGSMSSGHRRVQNTSGAWVLGSRRHLFEGPDALDPWRCQTRARFDWPLVPHAVLDEDLGGHVDGMDNANVDARRI